MNGNYEDKTVIELDTYTNEELNFFIETSYELNTQLNFLYSSIQLLDKLVENNEINFGDTYKKYNFLLNQNCLKMIKVLNNITSLIEFEIGVINPNFKIIMPKYIEKLDIIAVEVMFDGELKVAETKVYDNDDGTKTIEVQLEGTQTTFNNPVAKGATIVIAADITLEKATPTMETEIKVVAQNGDENKTTSENKTTVKYIAPSGVVTTNSVIGYNENEKLEVVNGEAKEALIQAKSNEKELTFEMNIINNYENTLSNAVILGRTMFKGNRDVDTLQDLGTTMNIPMSSKITLSGLPEENAEIYYSANGNATKDLANAENAWTKEITNYAEVKSYMIVFKNYDIKSGDVF